MESSDVGRFPYIGMYAFRRMPSRLIEDPSAPEGTADLQCIALLESAMELLSVVCTFKLNIGRYCCWAHRETARVPLPAHSRG